MSKSSGIGGRGEAFRASGFRDAGFLETLEPKGYMGVSSSRGFISSSPPCGPVASGLGLLS